MAEFMFATGIENSYPTIAGGVRVDEMEKCGHYERWQEDLALVREMGIHFLRWGPPLFKVHTGPGSYDWAWTDEVMAEMARLEIVPIIDLCHFGVPDWLGNFQNPDFPPHFAEYAAAFARRFPHVRYYTPVNEIYIASVFSALNGWWNEMLADDRSYVTALKHLCRANLLAMDAIVASRDDAVFIQSESSEYTHPAHPELIERAHFFNALRFLPMDFTFGHDVGATMFAYLMDHGLTREEYGFFMNRRVRYTCVVGNDYYLTNEHLLTGEHAREPSGEIFGYYVITKQYYDRYRLPIMHTETNITAEHAVQWLWKEWASMIRLRDDGIPIVGFTWYSLTDQMDWDTALREDARRVNRLGLYDLNRRQRPVGRAYAKIISEWRDLLSADLRALQWM